MTEMDNEQLVSLAIAARSRQWPRRRQGKKPAIQTLFRWARDGCRGVRLETVRVGGTLCTSEAAIRRFIERCTAGSGAAPAGRAQPQREHEHAERRLAAAGL